MQPVSLMLQEPEAFPWLCASLYFLFPKLEVKHASGNAASASSSAAKGLSPEDTVVPNVPIRRAPPQLRPLHLSQAITLHPSSAAAGPDSNSYSPALLGKVIIVIMLPAPRMLLRHRGQALMLCPAAAVLPKQPEF